MIFINIFIVFVFSKGTLMFIYKIINLITNEFYIGMTEQKIEKRLKDHVSLAKHCKFYKKKKTYLHNSILKYGEKNFEINLLEKVDTNNRQLLAEREIYWIKKEQPKYNMTIGGEGCVISSFLKKPRSKEFCKKISEAKKGSKWIFNPETLEEKLIIGEEKPNDWQFGRSPKTKHGGKKGEYTKERAKKFLIWTKNNPNGMQGKKHSEESKRKMSQKAKERWRK
jgi:group I intron endonuclease